MIDRLVSYTDFVINKFYVYKKRILHRGNPFLCIECYKTISLILLVLQHVLLQTEQKLCLLS